MHRYFSLLLFALAMIAAPFGSARAAAPMTGHAMAMTANGHCDDETPADYSGRPILKDCCVAACAATTETAPRAQLPDVRRPVITSVWADDFHSGIVTELPTPPPRQA